MKVIAAIAVLVAVFSAVWICTYPSTSDPKNIQYVLWKAGLYEMNLDIAANTMIGDAGRDKLVVGKTEGQLRGEFGYLLTASDASEYLRNCYQNSHWSGKRVLFIRKSPWMIIFDGNKATELVLIKGC
jgi:hypothetical protein